jgi:asparagine synthase (glutamine-hydrolysing)
MTSDFVGRYCNGSHELHLEGSADALTLVQEGVTTIVAGLITGSDETRLIQNPNTKGPAALLADAYLRWGDCFVRHVIGQFCGAVIDRNRGQVLLVQDSLGLRQLFYSFRPTSDELLFSSRLSSITKTQDSLRLDLEYFADFLAHAACCTERTPFQGVCRLTAGTNMRWRNRQFYLFRPWGPSDAVSNDNIAPADIDARLLELLDDSVAVFRNVPGPIWCDVSGGLDSTTVFEAARRRGVAVEPFSIVSRDGLDAGDTRVLEELFEDSSSSWHRIDVSDAAPFAVLADIVGDEPGGEMGFALRRAAFGLQKQHRVTHLLSGMGGDQVFGSRDYMPNHLADYLHHFALKQLCRELRHWENHYPESRPLLFWFFQYSLRPLFMHLRRRRISNAGASRVQPSWIHPDFSRKFDLDGRGQRLAMPRHADVGRNTLWQELYLTCAVEATSRSYALSPDYYYPLLHRPLVEFMLTRPYEERTRADLDRVLQRRALRGILPTIVSERRDKGTGQASFDRSFRDAHEWHRLLKKSPRLVDLGVFEPEEWGTTVDRARFGLYDSLPHFCASICCEIWLRSQSAICSSLT